MRHEYRRFGALGVIIDNFVNGFNDRDHGDSFIDHLSSHRNYHPCPAVQEGAPCSADVLAALTPAARRWAAAHAATGIVVSISSAQCADEFAFGSMQCEYVNGIGSCQGTGAIFHASAGEWTLIREGEFDCATEPDPTVRAACDAVGRTHY